MKQEKSLYIVDSSFVLSGGVKPEKLFRGLEDLVNLNPESFNESNLNYLREEILEDSLIVLEEVIKEIEEGLRITNDQLNYSKHGRGNLKVESYKSPERRKGKGRKSRRKLRKKEKEDKIRKNTSDEITTNLDYLSGLNNDLYKFLRYSRNKDPRKKFRKDQLKTYHNLLYLAKLFSRDMDDKAIRDKAHLKRQNFVGFELETDKKIVATSFIMAYNNPVYILTRDLGIEKLIHRVGKAIELNEKEEFRSKLPENTIKILNFDFGGYYKEGIQVYPHKKITNDKTS